MGYLFGLIGNPAKHSLSPWIHDYFLKTNQLQGIYRSFEVSESELPAFLYSLKVMKIDGFNITIPYKEKIVQYLDDLDSSAKQIGAVNTVVNKNGKWIGFNTDGEGYIRSLENDYPFFFDGMKEKKILLIGAGGACRAIYYQLNQRGFISIDIANRSKERAEKLTEMKEAKVQTNILSLGEAEACLHQYDLIIQTTNIGMVPIIDQAPITVNKIKDGAIFSDIVYKPMETKFLQLGKAKGANIHYGHGMLLFQAAYAFELWTGKKLNPASLLPSLEKKLK
jgi:shikimate dehydrogenase